MSTATRVSAYLLALAVAFGLALGVGRMVGPMEVDPSPGHGQDAHQSGHDEQPMDAAAGASSAGGGAAFSGLASSGHGLTLALGRDRVEAGQDVPLAFTVSDAEGEPVTAYDLVHEKRLHLIVVRRDGSGFQHLHPTQGTSGTWRTEVDLSPGVWRVLADFRATGVPPVTLGADLHVPGRYDPIDADGESRTSVVDGYTVSLEGDLSIGEGGPLALTVRKDGETVTDLQPHLGARGHLVVLRSSDLAHLHVHPESGPVTGGPDVSFHATAPSAGTYRLYFDFRHADVVRTASFTLIATDPVRDAGNGHEHSH